MSTTGPSTCAIVPTCLRLWAAVIIDIQVRSTPIARGGMKQRASSGAHIGSDMDHLGHPMPQISHDISVYVILSKDYRSC